MQWQVFQFKVPVAHPLPLPAVKCVLFDLLLYIFHVAPGVSHAPISSIRAHFPILSDKADVPFSSAVTKKHPTLSPLACVPTLSSRICAFYDQGIADIPTLAPMAGNHTLTAECCIYSFSTC